MNSSVVMNSIYGQRINDKKAVYFSKDLPGVCNDGSVDVSDILQDTINNVVEKHGYGIVYVEEGEYLLGRTIYIPKAVRVIGYGSRRPRFILKDNADNFDKPLPNDKGGYRYLFWFVDTVVTDETSISDANPGTFYSAMSNVDIDLGKGNTNAVALRTHYAQHSFVSYMNINVNSGLAGIYDVGNELENVCIIGGQYGIVTTKCSPGWPFLMADTYFEGQKISAIKTHEAGLTIVRCNVHNVPTFICVDDEYFERLYIENCVMENVGTVMDMAMEYNSLTQIIVKNLHMDTEGILVSYRESGRKVVASKGLFDYEHGTMISDSETERNIREMLKTSKGEISKEQLLKSDLKQVPAMSEWIDVSELGMIGDGRFDNTHLLNEIIQKHRVLFFPQGDYLFTDKITMKKDTVLIGFHPFSTKFILKDNAEAYSGFGGMRPFFESAIDGSNLINGIGLDTGGRNPRAAALIWHGGQDSYINDVKFIGGHGTLVGGTGAFLSPYNESRTADADIRKQWDAQYPSLVVKNGGGTFKDIWTASTYATSGMEIIDSHIPSKVYCISLEHHQRSEIIINNSANWKFYAFQTEEEMAEGEYACPVVIRDSENIEFNMAYFFRTIFVKTSYPYCVKMYGGKNVSFNCVNNVTQMKYTFDNFMLYVSDDGAKEIRPWQAAKIIVGREFDDTYEIMETNKASIIVPDVIKEYQGFRFADGTTIDSEGNFYFVDSTDRRVYKIDGESGRLNIVLDSPIKVNSLTVDTQDNLVFVGEYIIPAEATQNGEPVVNVLPKDSYGTSYGYWYNPNAVIVAFTLSDGEIIPLEKIDMGSIKPKMIAYPGNRWRDGSDYRFVLQYKAEKAFLMPDGCSIIPCQYDLIRANNLATCICGETLYSVDEMYKRVYSVEIDEYGYASNPKVIVEQGDYCVRTDSKGNLFVGDDNIKHYSNSGDLVEVIQLSERPVSFELDQNGYVSYVATRHRVYKIKY